MRRVEKNIHLFLSFLPLDFSNEEQQQRPTIDSSSFSDTACTPGKKETFFSRHDDEKQNSKIGK